MPSIRDLLRAPTLRISDWKAGSGIFHLFGLVFYKGRKMAILTYHHTATRRAYIEMEK